MTADVGAGTGIAEFEGWKHVLLRRMRNPTNESPDSLVPATKCLGSTVVLYNQPSGVRWEVGAPWEPDRGTDRGGVHLSLTSK
jgi:hypothetical protein